MILYNILLTVQPLEVSYPKRSYVSFDICINPFHLYTEVTSNGKLLSSFYNDYYLSSGFCIPEEPAAAAAEPPADESGSESDSESDSEPELTDSEEEFEDEEDFPSSEPVEDHEEAMSYLPQHDPCFTHCLHNTVKDALECAGPIQGAISKASAQVSFVRKSTRASDILEDYCRLQAANITRWSSQTISIRSVLKIPQSKLDAIGCPHRLTTYERNILTDLLEILTPFQIATDLLQGQNVVTASRVVPVVRGLRATVKTLQSKYNCALLTQLKKSVEKRLAPFEDKEVFRLAAALDPRYKLSWCNTQQERDAMKELLITKAAEKCPESSVPAEDSEDSDDEEPDAKRPKLFAFMDKADTVQDSQQTTSPAEQQVTDYLSTKRIKDKEDPLAWWKKHESEHQLVAELAKYYLAIPASSAPVERLFSIGGKIFRPERCCLSDDNFEALMMIRLNAIVLGLVNKK